MKKGILIVGEENQMEMQILEQQLASRLKKRSYPVEGEYFWPLGKMSGTLKFKQRGHERRISEDWIIYLEKDMRKIYAYLEKQTRVGFYGGMEEVMSQLGNQFCHCHKSYVVNMDKVEKMEDNNFLMKDGSVVPIGQRRKSMVRERFEEYQEQKNLEKLRFFESFSCFEI